MMKILNKNAGKVALIVGFVVCMVIGYYIGIERAFHAFTEMARITAMR